MGINFFYTAYKFYLTEISFIFSFIFFIPNFVKVFLDFCSTSTDHFSLFKFLQSSKKVTENFLDYLSVRKTDLSQFSIIEIILNNFLTEFISKNICQFFTQINFHRFLVEIQ